MSWLESHAISPALAKTCGVKGVKDGDITFNMGVRYQRIRKPNGEMRQVPTGLGQRLYWPVGGDRAASFVFLAEGEGDCLAAASILCDSAGNPRENLPEPLAGLVPVGLPGVSTPTRVVCGELLAANCSRCFICLDGDQAGRMATAKLTHALPRIGIEGIPVQLPDGKDLSDCLAALERATASGNPKQDWLANIVADAEAATQVVTA